MKEWLDRHGYSNNGTEKFGVSSVGRYLWQMLRCITDLTSEGLGGLGALLK